MCINKRIIIVLHLHVLLGMLCCIVDYPCVTYMLQVVNIRWMSPPIEVVFETSKECGNLYVLPSPNHHLKVHHTLSTVPSILIN